MLVGTSVGSISAKVGQELAGSTGAARIATGLDGSLEVNVVALASSDDDVPLVIASFDLLYIGEELTSRLRSDFLELGASKLILAASHTHQAPMIDRGKPRLGAIDEDYLRLVHEVSKEAITDAIRSMRPSVGAPQISQGDANHSVNRRTKVALQLSRRPKIRTVAISPNPRGARDETVCTLRLDRAEGDPLAIVWNYACHPVGFPDKLSASPHFPGVVRERLRTLYDNPGLAVCFLQGFSGNTRPKVSSTRSSVLEFILRSVGRSAFRSFDDAEYDDWSNRLAGIVARNVAEGRALVGRKVDSTVLSVPLSSISAGSFGALEAVHARVGELRLVVINGEAMAEHASELRMQSTVSPVMPIGCANAAFGYLPTAEIMSEGGYEGGGFTEYFGVGRLVEGAPGMIRDVLKL